MLQRFVLVKIFSFKITLLIVDLYDTETQLNYTQENFQNKCTFHSCIILCAIDLPLNKTFLWHLSKTMPQ